MAKNILLFWSSGKDSCLALSRIIQDPSLKIVGLITTLSETSDRVPFHGTSQELLQAQADSLSLPIDLIQIPDKASNLEYELKVKKALKRHQQQGITHLAFGDLFLSDIKNYREKFLKPLGFELLFPLWKKDTQIVAKEFIQLGYRAIITGVARSALSEDFLGKDFSLDFLSGLSPHIDPCGENGEFHTFVYGGPLFRKPIFLKPGKVHSDSHTYWLELNQS